MIVWLASFPRSGNTLLRTVLKQSMGLSSRSDSMDENDHVRDGDVWAIDVGVEGILTDWNAFYRQASEADEVFLVKTHRPPVDDQPAIYVVRDGRKACLSYLHFDRRFRSGTGSLAEIVVGIDRYGDWSSHYHAWAGRRNTFIVRFEDLVEPSAATLSAIADVAAYRGPIAPWRNPFDSLHAYDRFFFREGRVRWEGAPEWTPVIDALFFHLHQDLMVQLGYARGAEMARFPDELTGLVRTARQLGGENMQLERACSERLELIGRLTSECDSLRDVCSERLELIEQLAAECARLRNES
ncbi:sulfotransferase domain-containing protein [Bradyrhizobium diazoefficiens]|nr:sulfotransferase domain-containing protein [Bradyrhizobium diazoefficiens]MBR0776480.1 sulfotransferase domain-containing protein [Bradyrhizobium diazoefficiens]